MKAAVGRLQSGTQPGLALRAPPNLQSGRRGLLRKKEKQEPKRGRKLSRNGPGQSHLPQIRAEGPGGGRWGHLAAPQASIHSRQRLGWGLAGKALEPVRPCKVEGYIKHNQLFAAPATERTPPLRLHASLIPSSQCHLPADTARSQCARQLNTLFLPANSSKNHFGCAGP